MLFAGARFSTVTRTCTASSGRHDVMYEIPNTVANKKHLEQFIETSSEGDACRQEITMVQYNCPVWRLPVRRLEELRITENPPCSIYLTALGGVARKSQGWLEEECGVEPHSFPAIGFPRFRKKSPDLNLSIRRK